MPKQIKRDAVLDKVLKRHGNGVRLAKAIGCTPQAVLKWPRVPHDRVIQVEGVTGISRYELRPDLYPRRQPRKRARAWFSVPE